MGRYLFVSVLDLDMSVGVILTNFVNPGKYALSSEIQEIICFQVKFRKSPDTPGTLIIHINEFFDTQ